MSNVTSLEPEVGLFKPHERGPAIQTFSGRRYYIKDPRPDEIHIEDIAGPLSRICRFSGHCHRFYSVAQHCVMASAVALEGPGGIEMARTMLLHDAQEAYLGDVTRPLKQLLPDYRRYEDLAWHAIWSRFDLDPETFDGIKEIDNYMLGLEKATLLPNSDEWFGIPDMPNAKLNTLTPKAAELQFMTMFYELFPKESLGAVETTTGR